VGRARGLRGVACAVGGARGACAGVSAPNARAGGRARGGGPVARPSSAAEAAAARVARPRRRARRRRLTRHSPFLQFTKALTSYDAALKAGGAAAPPSAVADLRAKRAGALLLTARPKDAAHECDAALDAVPGHVLALARRARAREALGRFKEAHADAVKAAKADPANAELHEVERRLRAAVGGRRPAANGVATAAAAPAAPARDPRAVDARLTTPTGETVGLQLYPTASYADLLHAVRTRIPAAWPAALEFAPAGAAPARVTCKADVAAACAAAAAAGAPVEFKLVAVASEADVPQPPADEAARLADAVAARQAQLAKLQRELAAAQAAEGGANGAAPAGPPDLDAWLLDFAALFRDKLGVDADRPLDVAATAWDKVQAALDAAARDEGAPALFEAAADKFTEGAALSLVQAGNALLQLGVRAASVAADAKQGEKAAAAAFDRAAKKYAAADTLAPGHHEVVAAGANLDFERGKAAAGLVVPPAAALPDDAAPADGDRDAAVAAAANAALHAAMANLTPAGLKAADGHFKRAWAGFERAEAAVPADDRGKKQPAPPADGAPPEDEAGPWANVVVMWGNALYEASQMRAAVGAADWRPLLDAAAAKFRDAGCPEADVLAALRAHVKAGELGLPPVEGDKGKKTEAKGLPSLAPKKAAAEA